MVILALQVRFIRQYWPDTLIVLQGDSHFRRLWMLSWCARYHIDYLVDIGKNSRLLKEVDVPMMLGRKTQWPVGEKVVETFRFSYQAHAWKYQRWVVTRLEESEWTGVLAIRSAVKATSPVEILSNAAPVIKWLVNSI